jgi:hypothetical protein
MLYHAWKGMKANPGKKYPKRGEEKAPLFGYTRKEDGMLRGITKKFFKLEKKEEGKKKKKYFPHGVRFWDVIRIQKPHFLHWRSTISMYHRMRKVLIPRRKSRLAEKQPKKEKYVFPEVPKHTRKGWTEEESSLLEAVVAAHPTINDYVPTQKKYWQLFREQQPDFLKGRNNNSLAMQWCTMTRDQRKGKKKLSPLEEEAEDVMEDIEYEEEVNALEKLMVKKQEQLQHCNEAEMMDIIQEMSLITSSIERIRQSSKRQRLVQIVPKENVAEFVVNSLKK